MYDGWLSVCLNVRDLDASTRFYEALGMEVMPGDGAEGERVVLRSGAFRLGLFVGIGENLLNVRGADVPATHESLTRRFPGLEGRLERYTPGTGGANFAGACWTTRDPDRNAILFDTNQSEEGEPFRQRRIAQILRDTEHELIRTGASTECLETFRTQIIDRFCKAE